MTLPHSDVIEYIYDGLGRRVGRIKNSSITDQFVYSDQLQIIADLDPSTGEVRTRYVYASQSHSPDFMIRAGTTYRILKDRLGSVRLVVRTSDGVIAQEIEYDEFGRRLLDTNPGFQPFRFAGGLTDLETGLVRFGARDYDPITGRWSTKDPIGFEGGDPNLYGYVLQDPVNLIDPQGLAPNGACVLFFAAGGTAAGAIFGGSFFGVGGLMGGVYGFSAGSIAGYMICPDEADAKPPRCEAQK